MPEQRIVIEFKFGENLDMTWISTPTKFISLLKGYSGTMYLDSALLQEKHKSKHILLHFKNGNSVKSHETFTKYY